MALLFDPARVGMHDFDRARLARCYLGASNLSALGQESERAAKNRQVAERHGDDPQLGQLREITRPIHLVCVAANDMSGDPLNNRYRGARSAVLSGNGISLGNETARLDDLRLSSAMTASAAAFNSQMGRVSMDLDPAVGFLMSALNLRLGFWVPHPQNRSQGRYFFPGRFFPSELLGMSRTEGINLHFSDGNHFENFGLYELMRRHCRHILVSTVARIPKSHLMTSPMSCAESGKISAWRSSWISRHSNRTRQHAVVGTTHYNGITGVDKGTIVFFKPGSTGDESPDVLQDSTRNGEFPHEGTGDQFYDEAQWESSRRLGEHAVDSVLGFFEATTTTAVNVPDRLFRDVRSRWHPAPANQSANFLAMSERCASMEHDLMTSGPGACARNSSPRPRPWPRSGRSRKVDRPSNPWW